MTLPAMWIEAHRRRLPAAVTLLACVGVLAALAAASPRPAEPTSSQQEEPAPGSLIQAPQSLTWPVRIGELEERGDGWLVYRYEHPQKGFEIAFPGNGWTIAERTTSEALGGEVGLVEIFRRPSGYSRVSIYLAERPWLGGSVEDRRERAQSRASSTPQALGGTTEALLFPDIQVKDIDGGIPIIGDVYFDPTRYVIVQVAKWSSYQPDNQIGGPIDATTTAQIFDSFRFLNVVVGDK